MSQSIDNDRLSFHLQLLTKLININQYPLIKLVIENNITEMEYNELFSLLHMVDTEYKVQKEEGLLDFSSLLVHFAGMLNEKLEPTKTIYALKKEGYYPSLMDAFIELIERGRF